MNCRYCKDTGKYKQPNNVERFERLVDIEMEKAYFVNYEIAEEKAYNAVGYTVIDCPYCANNEKTMIFQDKYKLTPEESAFLAKKKWDENVYCGMRMENRAVTFPQTKTILNGVNVANVHLDDIQAILNMRDAWKYLMQTIDAPLDLDYICKLNEFIARNEALEWGTLRKGSVGISGTDYIPPIPEKNAVASGLAAILGSNTTATEKALNAFVWGARGQFFWDGNKRTSLTVANKILLMNGAGIMTITDNQMERFNELLVEYYNTGKPEQLKQFLYENAIQGIEK